VFFFCFDLLKSPLISHRDYLAEIGGAQGLSEKRRHRTFPRHRTLWEKHR
jgi:hypothetical protein